MAKDASSTSDHERRDRSLHASIASFPSLIRFFLLFTELVFNIILYHLLPPADNLTVVAVLHLIIAHVFFPLLFAIAIFLVLATCILNFGRLLHVEVVLTEILLVIIVVIIGDRLELLMPMLPLAARVGYTTGG